MTHEQQHALASSLSQLLVPEISQQISQAIATLERSPSNVATPNVSNTGTVNEQSNALCVHNDNDQNLSSVSITSIMDNIGIHFSQQLKEKIVKREYVDLENLLPVTLSEANNVGSRNIVMDQFGMLKLQTKTNKNITDICIWIDAFLTFSSIYLNAHPNSAQGLFKYMFSIKLGASRSKDLGWRDYDKQFRMKKERSPSLSWGDIDMELRVLSISQGHNSNTQSYIHQSPYGKCFDYNNKGKCERSNCRFAHKCIPCSEPRQAIYCQLKRKDQPIDSSNSSQGNFRPDSERNRFRSGRQNGPVRQNTY
jgi:hypothetical protein